MTAQGWSWQDPNQAGWQASAPPTGGNWPGDTGLIRVNIPKDLFSFRTITHQVSIDGATATGPIGTGSIDLPVTAGSHRVQAQSFWPDKKQGPTSFGAAETEVYVPSGAVVELFYGPPTLPMLGSGVLGPTKQTRPGYRLFAGLLIGGLLVLIAQLLIWL